MRKSVRPVNIHATLNDIPSVSSSVVNSNIESLKIVLMVVSASLIGGAFVAAVVVVPILLTASVSTNDTITTTATVLRWNSTGITVAGVVGVNGAASNLLYYPFGLYVDPSNSLYIADCFNNRVQKWLSGASSGTTVAGQSNTANGTGANYLYGPSNILLDSSGNIYVTDSYNFRIQLWSSGATSGSTIAGTTGSSGSANNQFFYPYGIARDSSSGALYVADFENHRVMCYLSGASSGTVVAGGNGQGTNNTQLFHPSDVYLDTSSNSLIIANNGANNIVRWVIGASSWTLVAGDINGAAGNTSTTLSYPVSLTLDAAGNVYVADVANQRVQFFSAGQLNGTTIAGVTGVAGTSSNLLYQPFNVALDSQRNLYVADTFNHRVQKFLRY